MYHHKPVKAKATAHEKDKHYKKILKIFSLFIVMVFIWLGTQSFAFANESQKQTKAPFNYTIAVLGDSLSAGYQLPQSDGFTAQLEQALQNKGFSINILNASVSGDTTSAGLARLDWSVPQDVDGVIIELGANDALRGIKPSLTKQNLSKILEIFAKRQTPVLLAGMQAPPNMGNTYSKAFNPIYQQLAEQYNPVFYPFFLQDVALVKTLNLSDGIHPNKDGVQTIVEKIMPKVLELIERIQKKEI